MIFSNVRQLLAFRAFLVRRLARYFFAETFFFAARVAPFPLNDIFFRWTLAWNPMHIPAALARAHILKARKDSRAHAAFQFAQSVIENRARVSASDFALMRVPEHFARRITRQTDTALYGQWRALERIPDPFVGEKPFGFPETRKVCPHVNVESALAGKQNKQITESPSVPSVKSVSQKQIADAWTNIETKWVEKNSTLALELAAPLIERGDFVSPFDAVTWARRLLEYCHCEGCDAVHRRNLPGDSGNKNHRTRNGNFALAEQCLQWAQQWTPERALVWQLRAEFEIAHGDKERAALFLERAACLNPESLEIFLTQQNLERAIPLRESELTRLRASAPQVLQVGETAQIECEIEKADGEWAIHVLPPTGWGIIASPRVQHADSQHRAGFEIRACRPDRVRGEPWALTFVAVSETEYAVAKIRVAVPDAARGKILLLVTEDHEWWEERGTISRDDVEKLLVEKSKFASEHFAPWTHMVEAGSSLALLDWAAAQADTWRATRDAVREHLRQEIKRGNDMQPHLHAFNLPASPDFPYTVCGDALVADKKFLLTAEQHRRDFARAYPPRERIHAVANAIAEIERVAHDADSNYRAVLWRSGQLEFGDTDAERAWSSVALLRAGLFADSDVPKKTFAPKIAPTAFFTALENPFAPNPGGEILQLPIAANLEGDFLTDARALQELAKRTGDALRDKPGVHLITLLTHDKFINARRRADEFRLDENYNEWQTIRAHLDAWRDAGAERVTAQHAVARMLDDSAWRLTACLCERKFVEPSRVRYTIHFLGKGIPVSAEYPQWVLVTIPPFLREDVLNVRVTQGQNELTIFENSGNDFWVRVTAREPVLYCEIELRSPRIHADASELHMANSF